MCTENINIAQMYAYREKEPDYQPHCSIPKPTHSSSSDTSLTNPSFGESSGWCRPAIEAPIYHSPPNGRVVIRIKDLWLERLYAAMGSQYKLEQPGLVQIS